MSKNLYELLSEERKQMQQEGTMPEWYSTAGWQLFKDKYLYQASNPKEQYLRIAKTAAQYVEGKLPYDKPWEDAFFELLWKGWLSPSTPVLSNMGTARGLPVSCSGQYIDDSIDSIYAAKRETAILTKHGFGTAGYFNIRGRGESISVGGKSSGTLPVLKSFIEDMRYVSQGSVRRGAFAAYLEIDHPDFFEIANYVEQYPDDANIGWVVRDSFIERLKTGDVDAIERYQKALKLKMTTGKGYFFFKDKADRHTPQMYKDRNFLLKNSQLCSEIMLYNSPEYTYTCVLSSMNLAKRDEWVGTDAVFVATVFLDCVAEDFIQRAKSIAGLEKAVAFTEKSRALGLGACGLHTLYQQKMLPFESMKAHLLNHEIFQDINNKSKEASKFMAKYLGEPDWCEGYGVRNTHLIAIAPTKSSSLIMGGVSEGINPDPAMTYTQMTAAGEVDRVNPTLLKLMKERNVYDSKHIKEIAENKGSVQNVDWLTPEEKLVFKTGFEIDQHHIIKQAATRQKQIDQGQSLNFFVPAEESEEKISEYHQAAFMNEDILSLYYCYSRRGVSASKGECESCQ